jgi:hypothetical protein
MRQNVISAISLSLCGGLVPALSPGVRGRDTPLLNLSCMVASYRRLSPGARGGGDVISAIYLHWVARTGTFLACEEEMISANSLSLHGGLHGARRDARPDLSLDSLTAAQPGRAYAAKKNT